MSDTETDGWEDLGPVTEDDGWEDLGEAPAPTANVTLDPIELEGTTTEDYQNLYRGSVGSPQEEERARDLAEHMNVMYGSNITADNIMEQAQVGKKSKTDKRTAAALGGYLKGATFGAAPRMYAGYKALTSDQSYSEAKDEADAAFDEASADAPVVGLVGDVAGSMFSGGAAVSLGKTALSRMGLAAAEGGTRAGFETEAEGAWGKTKDIATGSLLAGTFQGGGELVARGVGALRRQAARRVALANQHADDAPILALKEQGKLTTKAAKKLQAQRSESLKEGSDVAIDQLDWMTENLGGMDVLESTKINKAKELAEDAGNRIGSIYKQADEALGESRVFDKKFFQAIHKKVNKLYGESKAGKDLTKRARAILTNEMDNLTDEAIKTADGTLGYSFEAMGDLRSSVSQKYFNTRDKKEARALKLVLDSIDNKMEETLEVIDPTLREGLTSAKKEYGKAATAYDMKVGRMPKEGGEHFHGVINFIINRMQSHTKAPGTWITALARHVEKPTQPVVNFVEKFAQVYERGTRPMVAWLYATSKQGSDPEAREMAQRILEEHKALQNTDNLPEDDTELPEGL